MCPSRPITRRLSAPSGVLSAHSFQVVLGGGGRCDWLQSLTDSLDARLLYKRLSLVGYFYK